MRRGWIHESLTTVQSERMIGDGLYLNYLGQRFYEVIRCTYGRHIIAIGNGRILWMELFVGLGTVLPVLSWLLLLCWFFQWRNVSVIFNVDICMKNATGAPILAKEFLTWILYKKKPQVCDDESYDWYCDCDVFKFMNLSVDNARETFFRDACWSRKLEFFLNQMDCIILLQFKLLGAQLSSRCL